MQNRHGRRGAVFAIRVTDEERAELAGAQARGGGPRALGAWLRWQALEAARAGSTAAEVLPELGGAEVLPEQLARAGSTAPGRVVPRRRGITTAGAVSTRSSERPLILDLCAGSGSWSAPYEAAGYRVLRVTLPELDVRTFVVPREPVWGILAAPPCNQFSLARNGHPSPRDFVRGLECVNACVRIVHQCAPRWWALENPVGLLSKWLGTPRDVFEPCDFGDPWTKRTALWGSFALPRRGPFVAPVGGGPLCLICDPERRRSSWCNDAGHRAVTAPGFARAFFLANP